MFLTIHICIIQCLKLINYKMQLNYFKIGNNIHLINIDILY